MDGEDVMDRAFLYNAARGNAIGVSSKSINMQANSGTVGNKTGLFK